MSERFHKEKSVTYLIDNIYFQYAVLGRHSINKFQKDKSFSLLNQMLISNDGVIFNLKELLRQNKLEDIGHLFKNLYEREGWNFIEELRGNFSGYLYDSTKNKLTLFTDHLASKPVFYFYDKNSNTLIFSSELKVVIVGMRKLGFNPQLDMRGAYCLLTLGYMFNDITLIKGVSKLPPGTVLLYENGEITFNEYYKLSSKPYIKENEEMIIKELNRRFKEAVRFEYEKDLEYGYSHIATLSGGLDSRTNVAYAKKLGFDNITCFTFSQNDTEDKIAKKICSDNHFEFIFYSLDNGDYLLKNIDEIISSNDGLALYSGSSHGYNCLRKLSFQDYGLVHTGQLGDAVLGTYLQKKRHITVDDKILNKLTYSKKLINKLNNFESLNYKIHENDELFMFYERGINGIFNGYRTIEHFTEFSSPFLYLDFLEYVMRIPPKYKYKEAIYLKWINKCIPDFSRYKWEQYGLAPKYPIYLLGLSKKIMMVYRYFDKKHSSMNPTWYWWNSNKALQENINIIFRENISALEDYPDLLADCTYLFEEGSFMEKTQVITLLKAIVSVK